MNPYGLTRWILRPKPQLTNRLQKYLIFLNIQRKNDVLFNINKSDRVGSNLSVFTERGHNLGTIAQKYNTQNHRKTVGGGIGISGG